MASSKSAKRLADENLSDAVPAKAAPAEARALDAAYDPGQFEPGQYEPGKGARSLQQRLHETYASAEVAAQGKDIELSPFAQLVIIVTVSASLWALIGVVAAAAL